jgi:hypothetical protein
MHLEYRKNYWWLLPIIFLLGLWLRLDGIGFGLPYLYHVDESPYVVAAVRLGNGDLASQPYDPTGFVNILFTEFGFYFILGKIFGIFSSVQSFILHYETDRSIFFLLSRVTSAFLGAVTVLIVYCIGNRLSGRAVGTIASLFLAVCFLHVRDSHYGTPDITMAFFIALSMCVIIYAIQTKKLLYSFIGGLAGGLAVAVKWLALPVILPLGLGSLLTRENKIQKIFTFGLGLLLGFGLGSFQILLNPSPYLGKVLVEFTRSQTLGYEGWYIDTVPAWLFYYKTLFYGLGPGLIVLSALGLGIICKWIILKRDWLWAMILAFFIPYSAATITTDHFFARYILPIIPFLTLFASVGFTHLANEIRKRATQKYIVNSLVYLSLIPIIIPPLVSSLRHNVILHRQDTRTLAKDWIERNIPAGAKIAVDWSVYAPPLYTGNLVVPWVPNSEIAYDVTAMQYTHFLHDYPIDYYKDSDFDYLIASSFIYNLEFVSEKDQNAKEAFYDSIEKHFDLVKIISPYKSTNEPPWIYNEIYGPATQLWERERPGPILKIYETNQ